ncbi:hypothetical protein HA466_0012160 [Hirschfeldia incana]|nr:hypothetical protein HA466_0012160 [Hirschfeldia incana]
MLFYDTEYFCLPGGAKRKLTSVKKSFGTILSTGDDNNRLRNQETLLKYWLKMEDQPALIRDIVTKTWFKRKSSKRSCKEEAKRKDEANDKSQLEQIKPQ